MGKYLGEKFSSGSVSLLAAEGTRDVLSWTVTVKVSAWWTEPFEPQPFYLLIKIKTTYVQFYPLQFSVVFFCSVSFSFFLTYNNRVIMMIYDF